MSLPTAFEANLGAILDSWMFRHNYVIGDRLDAMDQEMWRHYPPAKSEMLGQTITRVQILLRRAAKALFPIELLATILEEAGFGGLNARQRYIRWKPIGDAYMPGFLSPYNFRGTPRSWSGTERMRVYNEWKQGEYTSSYPRGMLYERGR